MTRQIMVPKMILLTILLCLCYQAASESTPKTHHRISDLFDAFPTFNETLLVDIFKKQSFGRNSDDLFLLTDTGKLVDELLQEFSEVIERSEIGEPTIEGRSLELISFKQTADLNRTRAVLFDGAHHARELITIKMTLSILVKILHGVHHQDKKTLEMLKTTQVYFIPIVNPDGVSYIEENLKIEGKMPLKRKNGRVSGTCIDSVDEGVDLNRNYNISWDVSQPDLNICGQSYRGVAPFSEPETRSIRDFIMQNKDQLKFVVNYHAFGNMFMVPYQGSDQSHDLTESESKLYSEIRDEAVFPSHNVAGNAKQLLNYFANGEASDWMLHEAGVIAMSPELASESVLSFNFNIHSPLIEARVIIQNMGLPFYLLDKASPQLDILNPAETAQKSISINQKDAISVYTSSNKIKLDLTLVNKGMEDAAQVKVTAKFLDSNDQVVTASASIPGDQFESRSEQQITLTLNEISQETIDQIAQVISYGRFSAGRIDLKIMFEIEYVDNDSELKVTKFERLLPLSNNSMNNNANDGGGYLVSLHQGDDAFDLDSDEIGTIEALVVIILFVAAGHLLSLMCHRKSDSSQRNFYAKTEQELSTLNDLEGRQNNGSTNHSAAEEISGRKGGPGPDYVQF